MSEPAQSRTRFEALDKKSVDRANKRRVAAEKVYERANRWMDDRKNLEAALIR